MAKYKNIGEIEQTIPGVGVVKPGETVDIDIEGFNNANFQLVNKTSSYNKKVDDEEES